MPINYQAWQAVAEAPKVFMDEFQKAKKARAESMMQTPSLNPRDFGIQDAPEGFQISPAFAQELMLTRMKGQAAFGAPGMGYTLGALDPRFAGSAMANIPVTPKQAANVAQQGFKSGEISAAEAKGLGEAQAAGASFTDLAKSYHNAGLGKNPWTEWAAGKVTQMAPSPLGQMVAPEIMRFQTQKRLTAERQLRAATGAAAPAPEQVQYFVDLLPNPGDTPEIAQQKLDRFFSEMENTALFSAHRFTVEGNIPQARAVQDYVARTLGKQRSEAAQAFRGSSAPGGGAPPPLPPAGGGPLLSPQQQMRLDELRRKKASAQPDSLMAPPPGLP